MKYIYTLLFIGCISTLQAQDIAETRVSLDSPEMDSLAVDFGKKLEASLYDGKTDFFTEHFDVEGFQNKVMDLGEDIKLTEQLKSFNEGFVEGFKNTFVVIPNEIIQNMEAGSFYDFINYYFDESEQQYHFLFRMYSQEEGLNYHDYKMDYRDRKFVIEDLYIYATGEYFSETLQKLYATAIPKEYLKGIDTNESKFSTLLFITNYRKKIVENDYEGAYKLLQNVPESFKDQKIIYLLKINVAINISDVHYMEAIDDLLKRFPEDPSTYLMAIDYHIMLKDYNATMQALDALKEVTSDNFIEFIRGHAAWEFQDYETAGKAYTYIVEEYPDFEDGKINLMYYYDSLEMHEDHIKLLEKMIASGNYLKEDIIGFVEDKANEFEHLPTSKAFISWKEKK